MKTRFLSVLAAVILIVLIFIYLAEAAQDNSVIEASGVLEAQTFAVSIPPELALIRMGKAEGLSGMAAVGPSVPAGSSTSVAVVAGQDTQVGAAGRGSQKPVGVVADFDVKPGDLVKRGDMLFQIDNRLARQNLRRAEAQYEAMVATIERLVGTQSDLTENRSELSQAEADLQAKRSEAKREFAAKQSEARAKVGQMRSQLAKMRAGIEQARSGLEAAQGAELQALQMVEEAKALPETDLTKVQKIEQANATLQGAVLKQAELAQKIKELASAKVKLEQGISAAEKGLSSGAGNFEAGMEKIDNALAQVSEGRQKLSEGSTEVSRKLRILRKRRDQAETQVVAAKEILDSTKVRASSGGRIRDIKITEGSAVFPGQKVMSIAREDRLRLSIFVPLADMGEVKVGDAAGVRVDADSRRAFSGKVISVGRQAVFAPSNIATDELELIRTVKVIVEVANENGILKAGMPADVRID